MASAPAASAAAGSRTRVREAEARGDGECDQRQDGSRREVHADRGRVHDHRSRSSHAGHPGQYERRARDRLVAQPERSEEQRRERQLRHESLAVEPELQVSAGGARRADAGQRGRRELPPDEPVRGERRERHQHREHGIERGERVAREREHGCEERMGALGVAVGEAVDDQARGAAGDRCAVGHPQCFGVGRVHDRVVADVPAEHAGLVPAIGRGQDRERDPRAGHRPQREAAKAPPVEQIRAGDERGPDGDERERLPPYSEPHGEHPADNDAGIRERQRESPRRIVVLAQAARDAAGKHEGRQAEDRDGPDEPRCHAASPTGPDGSVAAQCPDPRRAQARTGFAVSRSCRLSMSAPRLRP